jgi:hypothetical protein
VRLFNPPSALRWNMHKSYLFDLEAKGVRIPRTQIVRNQDRVVVKPAISASAFATHVMSGDLIVQEFVEEIVRDGEWSFLFFNRRFSHAVNKMPASGDSRVQEELGGIVRLATPPAEMMEESQRILDLVAGDLLYARVDVVDRPAGITLMELELLEPSLFLMTEPGATRRFVRAIGRTVADSK